MGNLEKIIETLSKLTALEQRTADAVNYVERVEGRINNLYERIARLETAVEVLRENVKNAILADIRSDITRVQTALEYEARGIRLSDGPIAIAGREPKALPGAEIVGKRHTSQREATWTGFYYVNVSNDIPGTCDWDLNIRYSYVSAGGERQWVRAIQRLRSGDKVFAYIKRVGYVGYGVVVKGGGKTRRVADQNRGTPALCTPHDTGCQLFPVYFSDSASGPGSSGSA